MNILGRLESYFHLLTSDPLSFLLLVLYTAAAILPALILHECAHGYVAYRCGDPTAKMLGRLSLNPAKHLDPVGTACMVLLGFGWAKPVPVNPRNFRNYVRDDVLVSIAGVVTNFCLFLLSSALAVGLNGILWRPEIMAVQGGSLLYSFAKGSLFDQEIIREYSVLMNAPWLMYVQWYLTMFASMNLGLAVFNLLPFPPLDGSHIVNDLLLKGRIRMDQRFHEISRFVLLVLCMSGLLGGVLSTITRWLENGIVSLFVRLAGQV